jgi:glycosyltransferase involved in cell wall biosynthesis
MNTSHGLPLVYVLVTPAKNEEAFLELTIQSVVRQTVRPARWAIVSDGSTDRTDEIIKTYAARHDWIEFVRMPERRERHFGGKVACFNAGYERIRHIQHEAVVSLDADITFDEKYFEFLLGKLAGDPKLGLIGTPFSERGVSYDYRFSSIEHVSGACQMFRRQCFEEIGGYVPVKGGGIDVIAVLSARMKGWNTRTFTEKVCEHHRLMGLGTERHEYVAHYQLGQRQYRLGFHPLWQTLRGFYQMTRRPYVVGGVALLCGYFWAMIRHVERPMSRELVRFQQHDQMQRLRRIVGLGAKHGAT